MFRAASIPFNCGYCEAFAKRLDGNTTNETMKLIRDGNFSGVVRVLLFLLGIGMGYAALAWEGGPSAVRAILFMVAVVLCALGGYSSWAHTLGVRPFGDRPTRAPSQPPPPQPPP